MGSYRIARKEAIALDELIGQYVRTMKLSSGLDRRLIFKAWDTVSGVGDCTIGKYFRDGTLYITLSSSVVRNQLSFQKAALIEAMNRELLKENLFSGDGGSVIKSLVLK